MLSIKTNTFAKVYAIVDIETTGGSPKQTRITEIAIVIHNGKKIVSTYSTLVNPEMPITPFVIELTGITNEMVQSAPTFNEVVDKIDELTKDKIFVAHNSKFDYSFLRNEYRRLHRRFQRTHICTVQMSQEFLPGYPSYSLSKLCRSLSIPLVNKHRALDDAVATAKLFQKILQSATKKELQNFIEDDFARAEFPDYIDEDKMNHLPEEVGVFYLLNEQYEPIFIQKSKNIRHRVISYYTNPQSNKKNETIVAHTRSVDFVLTGSELVAELSELEEISSNKPILNNYRKRNYKYGLFTHTDENGYLRITSKLITRGSQPIIELTSKKVAEGALSKLERKYHLNQATRLQTEPEQYNNVVENALLTFHFENPNFIIVDEGRKHLEKAIVVIKDGKYYGYEYVEQEYLETTPLNIIVEAVPKKQYSTDKQQIIRKHLKKKNHFTILSYQ